MDTATGSFELLTEKVILRKASRQDDQFFQAVYASTRADEMVFLPWAPDQKAAFLLMQYTAQKTHYAAHFPSAQYFVITTCCLISSSIFVSLFKVYFRHAVNGD